MAEQGRQGMDLEGNLVLNLLNMALIILLSMILQQPPDIIRIMEATRQEWTGGREETGYGLDYTIRLVVNKSSAKLRFISITVETRGCDFKVSNITRPERDNKYYKGDTLLISAILKNPPVYPQKKEKPYPVIGYLYKKSIYYCPIRQGISIDKNNYK
jgi:hypothetical protein